MGGLFAERLAGFEQFFLEVEDAASGVQADAQLVGIEGLGEVIVGAGVHALDQILRFGAGGEEQDVDVGFAVGTADAAADFNAIHAGHHPIQYGQAGGILGLQDSPCFGAVARDYGFVAPLGEHRTEHGLKHRVVLGCQDAHGTAGGRQGERLDGVIAGAGGQCVPPNVHIGREKGNFRAYSMRSFGILRAPGLNVVE